MEDREIMEIILEKVRTMDRGELVQLNRILDLIEVHPLDPAVSPGQAQEDS